MVCVRRMCCLRIPPRAASAVGRVSRGTGFGADGSWAVHIWSRRDVTERWTCVGSRILPVRGQRAFLTVCMCIRKSRLAH